VETIPEKADNCFAVYEFKNYRYELGEDKMYVINSPEDNAVYSIDYNTGKVNLEIEGIANVYEGARPKIIQMKSCGGKLLLSIRKNSKTGVYVYDGKSISTSQKFENSLYVLASNDNYAVIVNGPKRDEETDVDLWDIKEMKNLGGFYLNGDGFFGFLNFKQSLDVDAFSNGISYKVIGDNAIWKIGSNYNGCFDILPLKAEPFESPSLINQEYVASYIEENGSSCPTFMYGHSSLNSYYCILRGNYMYVAYKRRIYRLNTKTLEWEEFLKMPLTIKNEFDKFCIAPDGTVYSQGTEGIQIYYPGKYDKPVELEKDLEIPFTRFPFKVFPSRYHEIKTDPKGNFVIMTGEGIYVYNPKGIVGYNNAVGRKVVVQ